jgi:Mce-associated membrane protein
MATDDDRDGTPDSEKVDTPKADTAKASTEDAAGEKTDTAKTDSAKTDSVKVDTQKARSSTSESATSESSSSRRPRLLVGVLGALVVILAIVAGVSVYYASSYRSDYTSLRDANADAQRAEDVASDYAVKAALIDYRDFDPWFAALRNNVDDKMRQQFAGSEPVLRQLLGQLQWVSKGDLVGSDIKSQNGGVYVVQVFVDVQVTNVQSPAGVKTTALYPITVDKNKNWTITDISGGVAPLAQGTAPN